MKVTSASTSPVEFRPFDITLRMETVEDAAKLFTMFGYVPVINALELDERECVLLRDMINKYATSAAFVTAKTKYRAALRSMGSP